MCYYRLTDFGCKHAARGKKVSNCQAQRDFLEGKGGRYCTKENLHAFVRIRVEEKCPKCLQLDGNFTKTRALLKNLRQDLDRIAAKRGSSMVTSQSKTEMSSQAGSKSEQP